MINSNWEERDKRGEWEPNPLPEPGVLFSWPPKPIKSFKYLFAPEGFLWPYNLIYGLLAVLAWLYFTPDLSRTVNFRISWIAEIYLRNVVLLTIIAGGLHLRLYMKRGQGLKFKYTDKWLAKNDKRFLFNNQTWDNIFWSLTSGSIIWTAYEALTLWMYANGKLPYIDFTTHPVYFVLLLVAILFIRYFHFYWIHRFSHWKPIFNSSHYLHHKNINVGPWTGLSMHPIEHLLYFSGVLIHWVIPSHPIHAIFHLMHAGISPALGHTGFHKLVIKGEKGLQADNFFHYLHHRYFTVNFGVEAFPLDKWFGSFHDGSPAAHTVMLEKRKGKKN
ncbi:MAG: sterol desaturase family protein [Spirochaetales bacterium]|nr:sterol desaturase family protein [Spirochaetales bacterium]